MKTIGLLGGMSWESTELYYRWINENVKKKLGKLHYVIYNELCLGHVSASSRNEFLRIIDALPAQGAEGVIEECTEIIMLLKQEHTTVPLFDTTAIHAEEAVNLALVLKQTPFDG